MKRVYIIVLVLILVFSLAACGGGGDDGGGAGGGTAAPASPAANGDDEHNCPCDPKCTNKECEGGAKCKCGADDAPPLTFDIEFEVELTDPECDLAGCGANTHGSARVTMEYIDSKTGYFGEGKGSGSTTKNGMHELAVKHAIVPGNLPDFDFTVQLSVPGDSKPFVGADGDHKTMFLSFDRIGPDEVTYDFSGWGGGIEPAPGPVNFTYWPQTIPSDVGTAFNDLDTGLMVFEMPLMDTPITVLFTWGEDLYVYIHLTPVG